MLLSLRLKEKFTETQEIIKEIFDFLDEYNLEETEMEWIVTCWCKIKRDMWKISKKETEYKPKRLTIADYLNIQIINLKYLYLLEEIRIYNCFR